MRNRDYREHIPLRVDIVGHSTGEPTPIFTSRPPLAPTIDAKAFDTRQRGRIKGG